MNKLYLLGLGSIVIVAVLAFVLMGGGEDDEADHLYVYCAAGMRYPMEEIAQEYKKEFGVEIQLDYAGSGALLSKIQENPSGDLYLAADGSYIEQAQQLDLAAEAIPLARMRPVIAVAKGNPLKIESPDDLLNPRISVVIGDPSAAIGKKTKKLLTASGHWEKLYENVEANGVTKPTVNDVANAVKMKSVDAGIIWDSTVAQYPELEAVRVPELDAGTSSVHICVLKSSKVPTDALRFARYVAARDRGLKTFSRAKFETVDGDEWAKTPEITLFAGAVNKQALEPIVKEFEKREGVKINTKYDGCGILTGQMRELLDTGEKGFPDAFMACDIYYLREVQDLFGHGTNVSDTDIVIVLQKGNPKAIHSLGDLKKDGVRVAIGEPKQCTIGVLTKNMLDDAGLYDDEFLAHVVMQAPSSALLVPQVIQRAADAALAYRTDTLGERSRIEVVEIDSPVAKAIQPYSVALSSEHKQLMERLLQKIRDSRNEFETAGFNWRLDGQSTTVAKPTVEDSQPSPQPPVKSQPDSGSVGAPGKASGVGSS